MAECLADAGGGRGGVLEEVDLAAELDDEGLVRRRLIEDVAEEGGARGALFLECVALRGAGVHDDADGERLILCGAEVADGLRLLVGLDLEVFALEARQRAGVLVAHDGEDADRVRRGGG